MTHEHAWRRLPDLLQDRDEPEILTHVASCHDCQRQLFLLGRVDRALRAAAPLRRKKRRRIGRGRSLRFPAGLVAAGVAALLIVLFLPHHAGSSQLTLRTASGHAIGHATLKRFDADNTSLTLVARGLPAHRGGVYVLWARGSEHAATTVGRFMVDPKGACRARFNLPGGSRWARFWVTPAGRPNAVVATT
jgi:hypothetical protein